MGFEHFPVTVLERAEALTRRRFRHVGPVDPILAELFRLGVAQVSREMLLFPSRYREFPRQKLLVRERPSPLDPDVLLRHDVSIPSLPQLFLEFQNLLDSHTTTATELAQAMGQDPGLSAQLLRLANSAFFGFPFEVDTVTKAVTLIGVQQISALAMGASVMSLFKDIPPEVLVMERFWMHCIACGMLAREICCRQGVGNPERCFLAGLLHDIGLLALLKTAPTREREALAWSLEHETPLDEAERQLLGFDHAGFGGMLLERWNLPGVFSSCALEHHAPGPNLPHGEAYVVHAAETMATALGIGASSEYFVGPPAQGIWDRLDLTPAAVTEIVETVDSRLEETFQVLLPR